MTIKLGEKVTDSLTGFEGTVTARAEYLYGCIRCELVSMNDPDKTVWIDEQRLEVGSKVKVGGTQHIPPSRNPH